MTDRTNAQRQARFRKRLKDRAMETERLLQERKALLLQIETLERLIAEAKEARK